MARSIVNILDLSVDEIHHLLDLADDIDQHPEKYQDRCAHKRYRNSSAVRDARHD